MSSEYGKQLRISVFGESHGRAIGVNIDGLPAGEPIDMEKLTRFMARRSPGNSELTTSRKEQDMPVFLSGLENGITCGFPLCAMIENRDTRSGDYSQFANKPRPSHADYTARLRYRGSADMRGGGHFSGRLTAPLCVAGGIALQILERRGVYVGAHLASAAEINDKPFQNEITKELFAAVAEKTLPVIDDMRGAEMSTAIKKAAQEGDSVGGTVECAVISLLAGVGSPMFDGIESRLAQALFGIPAVKGVEFGAGFAAVGMRGSEYNDPFVIHNGAVSTSSNNNGGILGGISTGMPVILRVAFKPTPSISKPQQTVDLLSMEASALTIQGRHDPCVAVRAVPVVEAVTATVILDILLEAKGYGSF